MGLSILCNFSSTRLLSGISLNHIESAAMTFLGKFGVNETETTKNLAKGNIISPVAAYLPANIVYGADEITPTSDSVSFGVNATGQVMQLPCTLFISFNARDITGTGAQFRDICSMWGDTGTVSNPGRFSIGLYKNAAGVRYVALAWGTTPDYTSCAVEFNWAASSDKIAVLATRDAAGNMAMELRSGSTILRASGSVTPSAIPSGSTNWRTYVGQISSRNVMGLRLHAGASWQKTLTPDQLTAEMDVMKVNLVGYV